jgi:hypothetical protein
MNRFLNIFLLPVKTRLVNGLRRGHVAASQFVPSFVRSSSENKDENR